MGVSGLGLCLSAESDCTGCFLDWKQILILFCVMHMWFFSPFFSYMLTGAGWTFLESVGKADILSCKWGVRAHSVCFRCVTDDETWCSILWALLRCLSGLPPGRPCLCEEQHVVAALVAPRTQSNLVMSGWHGAKLVIGKVFMSLGQVLPTEIHCWKRS